MHLVLCFLGFYKEPDVPQNNKSWQRILHTSRFVKVRQGPSRLVKISFWVFLCPRPFTDIRNGTQKLNGALRPAEVPPCHPNGQVACKDESHKYAPVFRILLLACKSAIHTAALRKQAAQKEKNKWQTFKVANLNEKRIILKWVWPIGRSHPVWCMEGFMCLWFSFLHSLRALWLEYYPPPKVHWATWVDDMYGNLGEHVRDPLSLMNLHIRRSILVCGSLNTSPPPTFPKHLLTLSQRCAQPLIMKIKSQEQKMFFVVCPTISWWNSERNKQHKNIGTTNSMKF